MSPLLNKEIQIDNSTIIALGNVIYIYFLSFNTISHTLCFLQ